MTAKKTGKLKGHPRTPEAIAKFRATMAAKNGIKPGVRPKFRKKPRKFSVQTLGDDMILIRLL